jgi:hypothetical protein
MALRYWVGGTDTWNNAAGTKWSATSGGASGASAPTASDDVFFNAKPAPVWAASTAYVLGNIRTPLAGAGNGFFYEVTTAGTSDATEPTWPTVVGNTVVDGTVTWTCRASTVTTAATATCLTANFTGFTGTFNAATSWTISLSLTFSAGMTITGTGNIVKTGDGGTWTFNGMTYTGGWTYPTGNGFNTTIGDDLIFNGSISNGINSNLNATSSRKITVKTNLTWTSNVNLNNVSFVMEGTGTLSGQFTKAAGTPTITIDTLGSITHNATLNLAGIVFTYVTGGWNSSAGILFSGIVGASVMNNVSSITFGSMSFGSSNGQNVTLNSDMYVTGGLSNTVTNSSINGTGRLYVGGSITTTANTAGTSVIEMYGGTNANLSGGTLRNSLIINKTSGATVTLTGNLAWGDASKQLILTSGVFIPQNFGISIPNATSVEINSMTFWNLTLGSGAIITQNTLNTINGTLTCSGSATFAGTAGWTTNGFTAQTANSTITLSNINANPSAEYRITGLLTLIGTLSQRIILQAAGSASFTGTANGTALTYTSGTVPSVGMTVSQATGQAPAGLLSLLPSRPTITGGTSPNFTISPSVTPTTGSILMRAGFKAKFILENNGVATQNVAYVTTQDIDSSDGQTILSFGSNGDNLSSNVALFRTLNWGPLIAPSGSVAFTWVN